jgi:flagellar biosynthetic protein FlhB
MTMPDDKDARTLPPTQRRIEQFRKRGEIALSRDLVAAAALVGGCGGLAVTAAAARVPLFALMHGTLGRLDGSAPIAIAHGAFTSFVALVTPTVAGAAAGCLAAMAVQLGWPPALRWPSFDFARPFAFGGAAQLFSPKAAAGRALKSALKVGFVGAAAAFALSRGWAQLVREPALGAVELAARVAVLVRGLCAWAGGALALLAVVDYAQARRTIAAKMRMTVAEMKREHKEVEGDPHVRRRRRQRMRELAKRRLAQAVPTADVVLVNPTEYAVALRYRPDEDRAPRVIAKGRGAVAERIRELARAAGVPILPEPPLTRLIHKLVPEGREIPGQLFAAVAEVLAYVYKLRGKTA